MSGACNHAVCSVTCSRCVEFERLSWIWVGYSGLASWFYQRKGKE